MAGKTEHNETNNCSYISDRSLRMIFFPIVPCVTSINSDFG